MLAPLPSKSPRQTTSVCCRLGQPSTSPLSSEGLYVGTLKVPIGKTGWETELANAHGKPAFGPGSEGPRMMLAALPVVLLRGVGVNRQREAKRAEADSIWRLA